MSKMIFNIVAEFDLTKKPLWLDAFRLKYDKPYRYHISFKTLTYFDEANLENLKNELEVIANTHSDIKVIFNELHINSTSKGGCIMIRAEHNKKLLELQNEISNKFSKFGKHISEEYENFERNFDPHITIARHLTANQFEKAKKDFKKDLFSEAIIDNLVLGVSKKDTFEEWSDPKNKSFYKFSKE